jgi:hypothetical protein
MTVIRRSGATSAAVLIGLSLSLAAAHAIAPNWSRRAGLDVWNYSALKEQYNRAAEERAEVLARGEEAAARRAAGNQIVAELIAGTISLPTAADELAEVFSLDNGMRMVLEHVHDTVPTERLRFARHAIDRVGIVLHDDPARLAAVRTRLEAEYRAMCPSPDAPHAR